MRYLRSVEPLWGHIIGYIGLSIINFILETCSSRMMYRENHRKK